MAILVILIVCGLLAASVCHEDTCYNKFEYVFNVLQKLADHEQQITSLLSKLQGAEQIIFNLQERNKETVSLTSQLSTSSSYIRWGKSICPNNATLVYTGYAAGSQHSHTGAAANHLCLPTDPTWNKYVDGFQSYGRIYGAEYETSSYEEWKHLHGYDVPCALCRIPRGDVVMVPGRNVCHQDYKLEYSGYLMSGAHPHPAASEYVCVDDDPERIAATSENLNGALFYHVEAECGSLKCPPYVNGRELTCAVCAYAPRV